MREEKRSRMEFEGEVVEDSNAQFRVKVSDSHMVLCTLSGKIRQNSIRILVGDRVIVEVSPYDTSKGRIRSRLKAA